MNVTKHARERWEQRVNPKAGENADEQIRQAFTNAEYIWCDEGALYYANSDHWIFVVDEQGKNIITVFEIDYGFPNDINRTITNELTSKMGELRVEVERVKNESNLVVDGLVGQINLSLLAQQRYCELIGKEAHFYRIMVGRSPAVKTDINDESMVIYCVHQDYGQRMAIAEIPDDEILRIKEISRNDPTLVQVVEELGKKANGLCSELKIIEIPDDVEWQIEEYDGAEWISEKHRVWS